MKNIHKHLEFKITEEGNKTINYLDLSIHRNNNKLQLGIYRKPTQMGTTIHFMSNHPLDHKLAAYNFYTNNVIYTNYITSKRTRMEHHLHHS